MFHTTYDWLIVGGGVQGAYAASALTRAAPNVKLAIVDPCPPLAAWRRRAEACGMTYLRSPSAHHLGAQAGALRTFAADHGYDETHWLGAYRQPSRALFEAHSATVTGVCPRIASAAEAVEPCASGWQIVDGDGASHRARRVVIATGPGAPRRPLNAPHVFDVGFDLPTKPARLVVIGGGISAAQLALRAATANHAVTWITRERPRRATFDSDPCFAGPKCLAPFRRASLAKRRRQIAAARRPGTLPPAVYGQITAALAEGRIDWRRAASPSLTTGGVALGGGIAIKADHVVLATGLSPHPAADRLLGLAAARYTTGFDADGHLALDIDLQIAPGLHVLGRPASLQLGPMAPNIKGARLGGERLAALARGEALAA